MVIPTSNRSELLAEALQSIRAVEGADLQLEPIVIDDGDDAGTRAVAARHGARYLRSPSRGAAAARNAGLRAASGEFIAFLDDDDRWLPGHLRSHIRVMRERPEVSAVFGQAVSYDSEFGAHTRPWPDGYPRGRSGFERVLSYQPQLGATVVRSSAVASVGFFEETLSGNRDWAWMSADEDWDWQLRLAIAHNVEFIAVPSVGYRCRPRRQTAGDDLEWRRLPYHDRVFWTNVRRAGRARPRWLSIIRRYAGIRGQFAVMFLDSGVLHWLAGDRRSAGRQLIRGMRASPLHAALWLARKASARRSLLGGVTSG